MEEQEMERIVGAGPDQEGALRTMARDWREYGDDRHALILDDFEAFLAKVARDADAERMPAGRVPSTWFGLLVDGVGMVASSRLRHFVTPAL